MISIELTDEDFVSLRAFAVATLTIRGLEKDKEPAGYVSAIKLFMKIEKLWHDNGKCDNPKCEMMTK